MSNAMRGGDRYSDAPPEIAEEIRNSVEIPDDFPSPEELKRDLKRTITIRLDPEVYAWFQLPGPGYQTRINDVLRAYVRHMQTPKAKAVPFGHPARGRPRGLKVGATAKKVARRPAKKAAKKAAKKRR